MIAKVNNCHTSQHFVYSYIGRHDDDESHVRGFFSFLLGYELCRTRDSFIHSVALFSPFQNKTNHHRPSTHLGEKSAAFQRTRRS
jgi:hypothetical protein